MKKFSIKNIIPFFLVSAILFTGCHKKSDCDYPTRHAHLYKKYITNDIIINKYLDSENENNHGFMWTEERIDLTSTDAEVYKLIDDLFDAYVNWDYLYYVMASHHDYLMFYYEYEETYTTTDSEGNTTIHSRTVDGWHTKANDSDNTGRTRLYHHKYFGYRIILENGKYKLEKSPYVDDIREIINDYPWIAMECWDTVYKEYRFKKRELKNLSPEQFNDYNQPDLTNNTPYLNPTL